ncbi:IucA/IucC family siderophore biosynthesis protein [Flavobacterium columnare]|uniref:IucA/IucC family siderophore biosynthesis protein n=2 Tax=Flavobacterium TaxID=237 RepID=A0A437UDR5_9FLAO|nr:IucA/IucC family siderophore biosynthesis protein [Flavobacterium columnare]RVU91725.1 IucA/IucC family siderophore biosynthesis protein [Flavobacterium columnare]
MDTKTSTAPILAENIKHLKLAHWEKANRLLTRKAISEFSHETLISPIYNEKINKYQLNTIDKQYTYTFPAHIKALNNWHIPYESIIKEDTNGNTIPLCLISFILEFKDLLEIPTDLLPTYLEEINATLYSTTYKISKEKFSANELPHTDYQTIEHSVTEGHPCFLANSGKNGFSSLDFILFSPEANSPIQLLWVAGHKSSAQFSCIDSLSYDLLIKTELDNETQIIFQKVLETEKVDPNEYLWFPVHPWQWDNKLTLIFTHDIAQKKLIPLGFAPDKHSAQQSIRTFYNLSNTSKHFTKTALSVINMGFMRGLSPYYMESTPVITTWLENLVQTDPFLQSKGFTVLGEVATLGYRNILWENLGKTIPHNKMLATLWRESPATKLQKDEDCFTMAALLHLDYQGQPFIKHLIESSKINSKQWIDQYLQAYLIPLIHCFYTHELVFMPHGENLILVIKDHIIERVLIKDITEEIMLFNHTISLPEKAERIRMNLPDNLKILSIQNDIFQHFFRFLSAILDQYNILSEHDFWKSVGTSIAEYQLQNPQLKESFIQHDIFSKTFDSCCLNRLQLKNNKQMLDLADPASSLQFVGTLENPIHQYKPVW